MKTLMTDVRFVCGLVSVPQEDCPTATLQDVTKIGNVLVPVAEYQKMLRYKLGRLDSHE